LLVDDTWGQAQPKDADAGNLNLAGDIGAFARYDSLVLPFALVMGIAGTPVTVGGTGREHTLKWANSLEGINATMAMDTLVSIDEFPSLKFGGFTLHQIVGQPADITFNVIANTKRYSTDTTDLPVNVAPFPSLVTTTSPRYRLMGHHCRVRANLVSGAALALADELCFNEFTLTVSRGLVGDFCFNGSRIMDEPELDAVPTATLQMNWPVHRAQSDQFLRWAKSDLEIKMDITWTHPDLAGAGTSPNPYTFRIDMPRGRIGSPTKTMTGPGRIPYSQTVQLLKPDVASTGMPLLLDFMQLYFKNRFVANPLA
jgi:hypothetical protein